MFIRAIKGQGYSNMFDDTLQMRYYYSISCTPCTHGYSPKQMRNGSDSTINTIPGRPPTSNLLVQEVSLDAFLIMLTGSVHTALTP